MNSKKKLFTVGLLCLSLLGVGAASAFVVTGANASTSGTVDDVVYLNWGESTLANITNLTDTSPVYQKIAVAAPNSSVSSGFTAKFGITMTVTTPANEETYSLEGVTIDVAESEWGKDTPSYTTCDVNTPFSLAITAAKTFYLRYSVTSEAYAKYVAKTLTMSGKATFTYTAA